jgi:hypothetical protein
MHERLFFFSFSEKGEKGAQNKKRVSHLTRFSVPEKVGPVGVRLHLSENEEFSQAEINHARRYLRLCRRIM